MNFSQLHTLVALAETGSFTAAAEKINLSQSAVSHALAALESELGVSLLERTRKGVVAMTPVGERVMPHVHALLAHAEAIEQEAKAANGLATGKLRVGNSLCFCPGVFAGVLTAFQRHYPAVELVLFEGTLEEIEEWLATSLIDVGFLPLPSHAPMSHVAADDADVGMGDHTLLTTDELCVVMNAEHRLHRQRAITSRDLANERFIMPKSGCTTRLMEMAGINPSRIQARLRYQASDSATILTMVREGLGITLMPRMSLPTQLEGVVARPLDPVQPLQVGLAIRSRKLASPAAKLFVEQALAWAQANNAVMPQIA